MTAAEQVARTSSIHAGMTVNEVTQRYPDALIVLHAMEDDACCGGRRTLEEAANAIGLDVRLLVEAVRAVARR